MHLQKRTLYYVGRTGQTRLQARLSERSWNVVTIEYGVVPKLARGHASAGLLDFSSFELPNDLCHLHELLADPRIGWVALAGCGNTGRLY
jgi:hypothetical protein